MHYLLMNSVVYFLWEVCILGQEAGCVYSANCRWIVFYKSLVYGATFSGEEKIKEAGMARVTVKVSDLTGNQIPDEQSGARLVVEHPDFPEPIGLDVLPDEVLPLLTDENSRFVIVSMSDPESPNPQRYVLSLADFNQLFQREDMYNVLQRVLESQQEEDATSRRGRGRKAASETPRPRVDYSSAGHAGEP